ncbi:MAG: zinc-ribbon domain-containing protein [Pseudomonadota bacterium]
MEVTCEHCNAKLNIPDEKIPKDQVVKIGCPKCKNKITLDTRQVAEPEPSPAKPESQPASEPEEKGYSYDDYSDDQALGIYEEGAKLALVLDSHAEHSEKIKGTAEGLGYQSIVSLNTRDAIGKFRFHQFDLVILSDGFDGQSLDNSPILNYMNHVSMSVRRRIFLALIGDKFKTMDNMMAFAKSANVVINSREVDKLSSILKKAITENEKFYKVFMDTLAEVGKA